MSIPASARAEVPRRLLVCSIGNPGLTYLNTRHSAGHFLNDRIREKLGFPEWQRGLGGLVSTSVTHPEYTLWKSPSLMNISGKPVKEAWKSFLRELGQNHERAVLVIMHDDLERGLGKVRLRLKGSPQGHNGLKSIIKELRTEDFRRLGIGIERPESRDSDTVARYVLGKFNEHEKRRLSGAAVHNVLDHLKAISRMRFTESKGPDSAGEINHIPNPKF